MDTKVEEKRPLAKNYKALGEIAAFGKPCSPRQPKGTSAKRHRKTLIAHLANPDNEWPEKRTAYAPILGFKGHPQYIYRLFTAEELGDIESEALRLRRGTYAHRSIQVDKGLFEAAKEGKAAEAKLFYQRFEGWSPKETVSEESSGIADKLCDALLTVLKPVYMGEAKIESSGEANLLPED